MSAAKGVVSINEKRTGHERFNAALTRLSAALSRSDFGQPVNGTTRYTVCVYGGSDELLASMEVDRAGAVCGTAPCWKALGPKGFRYFDDEASAGGIAKIVGKGGHAGRGQVVVSGRNNSSKGQTALPTELTASLAGSRRATLQGTTSDAACFSATVTHIRKADRTEFRATKP